MIWFIIIVFILNFLRVLIIIFFFIIIAVLISFLFIKLFGILVLILILNFFWRFFIFLFYFDHQLLFLEMNIIWMLMCWNLLNFLIFIDILKFLSLGTQEICLSSWFNGLEDLQWFWGETWSSSLPFNLGWKALIIILLRIIFWILNCWISGCLRLCFMESLKGHQFFFYLANFIIVVLILDIWNFLSILTLDL